MNQQLIAISAIVIIGLGLVNSVHAIDQHFLTSGIKAMVNLASFNNIMSACRDLYNAGNVDTFGKCVGMIDKLNNMMNQTFIDSKTDIDQIFKKANYTQADIEVR